MRSLLLALALPAALPALALAQPGDLLVPDSTNDRIMLFSGQDGSLINANFITDTAPGFPALSTPKVAIAVGNEIWVADQITDAVQRYSFDGTQYLGAFTTLAQSGVDNLRGLCVIGDRVYISCGSGTFARRVVIFNRLDATQFTAIDYDPTSTAETPYDIRAFNGRVLIADDRDDIFVMDENGSSPARLVDSTGSPGNPLEFCQHIGVEPGGTTFLSGSFFTPGGGIGHIVRFNSAGAVLESFTVPAPVTGVRAVHRLGNGAIFATLLTNTSTQPHPILIRQPDGTTTFPHDALGVIDAQFISVRTPFGTGACSLADITEVGGTLEVPGTPDGQLTVDDLILFVNAFSDGAGCPGEAPCNRADVVDIGGEGSPDGQLTVDDLIAFVNAFSTGC